MSTSLQPNLAPSWKQEVNQRLAAHKSRKGLSLAGQSAPEPSRPAASNLAAQAAARVAARYAKAPSYSQMQAAEARTALRAAKIATEVALEAQAAAEAALANLETASEALPARPLKASSVIELHSAPAREPVAEPVPPTAPPTVQHPAVQNSERQTLQIRWEPDMPERQPEPEAARAEQNAERLSMTANNVWEQPAQAGAPWEIEAIEPVEPIQPLPANLIEFPRELVATRRFRPRLAEETCTVTEEPEQQLSIFEVDPASISTQTEAEQAAPAAFSRSEFECAAPRWSGMDLSAQTLDELLPDDPPIPEPVLQVASFSRRLMAVVVDGALIATIFTGTALVAVNHISSLPSIKVMEMSAVAAFFLIGALYQTIFFTLAEATPGMKYARISLCTFDDQNPSRAQLHQRLGALLLSLGVGMAWAIFDDDHLSWHDRLSKTYLRSC